jgi:hypothetical protein
MSALGDTGPKEELQGAWSENLRSLTSTIDNIPSLCYNECRVPGKHMLHHFFPGRAHR